MTIRSESRQRCEVESRVMPETSRPSAWRLVKIPALITLIVTLARLTGELLHLDLPLWFGSEAGGNVALVGIVWLVPIFGAWFGWRTVRWRPTDKPGIAIVLHLFGLVVLIGGVFGAGKLDLEFPAGILALGVFAVLCSLFAARAWPALYGVNLLYGLLARIPVVLITFPAVFFDWGTHYEKLPPGMELPDLERALRLALFQFLVWVPFTILLGGLFGSIAGWLRRSRPTSREP
jgi:hypothetical protein